MLGLQSDSGAKNWTPRREISSPIFLDRFQRQNRCIFHEKVDMLDEQVNIFDNFRNISMLFDFFLIVQKVFPRIPGGSRHQESAGNRVLDKFYRRFCDIFF